MTIRLTWRIVIVLLTALLVSCGGESTEADVSAKFDEIMSKSNRLQAESCSAVESDWNRLGSTYDDAERAYFNASASSDKMDALERIDDLLDEIGDAIDDKC